MSSSSSGGDRNNNNNLHLSMSGEGVGSASGGGGGGGGGHSSSGRSPYPPSRSSNRRSRQQQHQQQQQHQHHSYYSNQEDSFNSSHGASMLSPPVYAGQSLWKMSNGNNSVSSSWSPNNSSSHRLPFAPSSAIRSSGIGKLVHHGEEEVVGKGEEQNQQQKQQQQQQEKLEEEERNEEKFKSNNVLLDGIPVNKLREMTKLALGTPTITGLPSTAVFYASLLYAKTQSFQDAYLYAKALENNGEYKRCVRVLEQSSIINITTPTTDDNHNSNAITKELQLEAILLASESLATIHEWQSVIDLLEDSTQQLLQQANYSGDADYNIRQPFQINPATPAWMSNAMQQPILLDDQDDIAWETIYNYIGKPKNNTIHPLSRFCLLRGKAYSQIGHPTRAALYWKRAISIDSKCVQALDCLLSRCLLTPEESYQLITSLEMNDHNDEDNENDSEDSSHDNINNMEWLRDFYLARIELSPQDTTDPTTDGKGNNASVAERRSAPGEAMGKGTRPFVLDGNNSSKMQMASFNLDASAIQMSSPLPIMNTTTGNNANATPISMPRNNKNHHIHQSDEKEPFERDTRLSSSNSMQMHVDRSFHKLWNTHNLRHSPEVLAMAARRSYKRYDWHNALKFCQELSKIDPLCQTAAYVYIATLVALGHKRPLFTTAHEWVNSTPRSCRAWFAVGSYYYVCERYHIAQKHFCRATRLDPYCTEAWIAFGCSFASCDESDQALASFRAAQRLSPGEYSSLLYMGMEYLRTNHLVLAQYFLTSAYRASGADPLCLNELGVLSIQRGDYPSAIGWFIKALQSAISSSSRNRALLLPENSKSSQYKGDTIIEGYDEDDDLTEFISNTATSDGADIKTCLGALQDPYWESTIFNLGQCFRKTRRFNEAASCFERCVALCPDNSSGYAALAFTKHLMGHIDNAIDLYHQALSCKPDDPFSSEMLNKALQDALSNNFDNYENKAIIGNVKDNDDYQYGHNDNNEKYDQYGHGSIASSRKGVIPDSPSPQYQHGEDNDGSHFNSSSILMTSIEGGPGISIDTTGDDIDMSLT